MIVGICGAAGSGKDTAADHLIRHFGFVKLSFADPMKRFCADVFGFSRDQLWGPSEMRNAPDPRYRRARRVLVDQDEYEERLDEGLSPREALQTLGTEWGRKCFPSIWVDYALRIAKGIDGRGGVSYTPEDGTFKCARDKIRGVVIPDLRFRNEVDAVKAVGGKTIRVKRPGAGLAGAAGQHQSEQEMAGLPDDLFDSVILNGGSLEEYREAVSKAVSGLFG